MRQGEEGRKRAGTDGSWSHQRLKEENVSSHEPTVNVLEVRSGIVGAGMRLRPLGNILSKQGTRCLHLFSVLSVSSS